MDDISLKDHITQQNCLTTDVVSLGQSGFRFNILGSVLYIDPYLSHHVESRSGKEYKRQVPIWRSPYEVDDANWVLITHIHLDHCDLETLLPLSKASPTCQFVAPALVCEHLHYHGIEKNRLQVISKTGLNIGTNIRLYAVPAAHPTIEVDVNAKWQHVGYIIEYLNKRIYHAGDTALTSELINYVSQFKDIDTAFLPVNEMNYVRQSLGIIGNMSIRDAFYFAATLNVKKLVPMHWDMFAPNALYREEIELHYQLSQPPFQLLINPTSI